MIPKNNNKINMQFVKLHTRISNTAATATATPRMRESMSDLLNLNLMMWFKAMAVVVAVRCEDQVDDDDEGNRRSFLTRN